MCLCHATNEEQRQLVYVPLNVTETSKIAANTGYTRAGIRVKKDCIRESRGT